MGRSSNGRSGPRARARIQKRDRSSDAPVIGAERVVLHPDVVLKAKEALEEKQKAIDIHELTGEVARRNKASAKHEHALGYLTFRKGVLVTAAQKPSVRRLHGVGVEYVRPSVVAESIKRGHSKTLDRDHVWRALKQSLPEESHQDHLVGVEDVRWSGRHDRTLVAKLGDETGLLKKEQDVFRSIAKSLGHRGFEQAIPSPEAVILNSHARGELPDDAKVLIKDAIKETLTEEPFLLGAVDVMIGNSFADFSGDQPAFILPEYYFEPTPLELAHLQK